MDGSKRVCWVQVTLDMSTTAGLERPWMARSVSAGYRLFLI
ncbi:MAG: hypothetical protein HLUCCO02_10635 [Idiomarinaceae bacterium HL-53]|nr:MAG: hypothetical protein HLUCCO02_10635 [Idiomarinaceae bacterium HL-53]